MAIRSDSDLPGPRPANRHSAHEYFTISGRGRDPRGEVTRTLDDASESWTKANRENAGRSRHEAIETKDVGGNARSDLGVAQDDERCSVFYVLMGPGWLPEDE